MMADHNTNMKCRHFDSDMPNLEESIFHTTVIICAEPSNNCQNPNLTSTQGWV